MSRNTKYWYDEKGEKYEVNWGTDRALGYWYDMFRLPPTDLSDDARLNRIDIDMGKGYIYPDGTVRQQPISNDTYLIETDTDIDEWTIRPSSNHIRLAKNDIYITDWPIVDKNSRFTGLTHAEWADYLAKYGVRMATLDMFDAQINETIDNVMKDIRNGLY